MISAGQQAPFCEMEVAGITYTIAVLDDTVRYIAADEQFVTPEGIQIGSTLREVLATGARNPRAEWGWSYETRLASGWSVGFFVGSTGTDTPPTDDSTVTSIFKR